MTYGRIRHYLPQIAVLLLILCGFARYTIGLDSQSIWRDEALSIGRAHQPISLILQNRNIVQGVDSADLHPPIYFLLLSGWRQLSGESAFAYRYFSVLALVLNLALLHALARRVSVPEGRRLAAVLVVWLAILSPYYWWYAQEARMYTLVALEMTAVLYVLWPCLKSNTRFSDYVKLFGLLVLLSLTHYSGAFVFAFVIAVLVLTRLSGRLVLWIAGSGVLLLLLSVPFYKTILDVWEILGATLPDARSLWEMFFEGTVIYHLGAAEPLAGNDWWLWSFWLIALCGVWGATRVQREMIPRLAVTAGAFLITFAAFYFSGFIQPNYVNPRHFMVLSVPYLLLVTSGLVWLFGRSPFLGWGGTLLLSTLALTVFVPLWQTPPQIKDDVRGLAAYLSDHAAAGDLVVWHDASHSVTYDYYAVEDLPYIAYPPIFADVGNLEADYQQLLANRGVKRVWFIDSDNTGLNQIQEWMDNHWRAQDFTQFAGSWTGIYMTLYTPPVSEIAQNTEIDIMYNEFVLHSADLSTEPLTGGVWVDFLLSTVDPQTAVPDLCIRLKDVSDLVWSESCGAVLLNEKGIQPDQLFLKQLWLDLPVGLQEGAYGIELLWGGSPLDVGEVMVAGTAVVDSPLIDFGGLAIQEAELLGSQYTPSSWLLADVVWQLSRPWAAGDEYLSVTIQLDPIGEGEPLSFHGLPIGTDDTPAHDWEVGDVVRQRIPIYLPAELAEGGYQVKLFLQRPAGSSVMTGRTIGDIDIKFWELVTDLPAEVDPLVETVEFANEIMLAGAAVAGEQGDITIDLYWQANENTSWELGGLCPLGRAK